MLLQDLSMKEFLASTASNSPVPGGGSVSALCACLGSALCSMVANLTVGKKNYAAYDEQMSQTAENMRRKIDGFLNAIDEDSDSFNLVMSAFKLPKSTDEEKAARTKAIRLATVEAAKVPLSLARKVSELFPVCEFVAKCGNKNALSDVCVAVMLLRTAVLGALYNVKINLASLPEDDFRAQTQAEVDRLEEYAVQQEKAILSSIEL